MARAAARDVRESGEAPDIIQPKKGPKPAAAAPKVDAENPRQGRRQAQGGGAEEIAAAAEQPRDAGKFASKAKPINVDIKDMAREALRRLSGETDREALDTVKPKVKDPKVDPDPAPESDGTTEESDPPEQSSLEATRERRAANKHLSAAQQALELEGWTEEELANLPDNRILALGRRAKELQSEKGRELRGNAKSTKTAATDPDPEEDGTTDADESEADDSNQTVYGQLAKKHFGEDPDHEWFAGKLGAFAKDLTATIRKEFTPEIVNEMRSQMRGEKLWEDAVAKFSVPERYPQLATSDGQAKVMPPFTKLLKTQLYTFDECVDLACKKAFGAEKGGKGAKPKPATTHASARDNGQVITNGTAPTPTERTLRDHMRAAVKKHILNTDD